MGSRIDRAARRSTAAAVAAATVCGALFGAGAPGCSREPAESVLVVANAASPVSLAAAGYYSARRGIPDANRLDLDVPLRDPALGNADDEIVSRDVFEARIRDPIADFLAQREDPEEIRILVLVQGVPLRIRGTRPPASTWLRDATGAAVDSELAILGSGLDGSPGVAATPNPYYDSPLSFDRFREEQPDAPLRFLVARLAAYPREIDDVTHIPVDLKALVDRATPDGGSPPAPPPAPAARTIWLVDRSRSGDPGHAAGDRLLLGAAASALEALGRDVVTDPDVGSVSEADRIQAYASWGSNDPDGPPAPFYGRIDGVARPGRFAPRSIATDFVSTSARSFHWPPHYGQSLLPDLIGLGVAGAAGHVDEPTLAGVARPHILLWHYARGATAIEAFYRSVPYLGWMNVWIGDPLMQLPPEQRSPGGDDRDGDGLADDEDNCLAQPNPDQRDADEDGFGNLCDPDVDGDGVVTTSWGRTTPLAERGDLEWIALAAREEVYDPKLDLDGDGAVDASDVAIATLWLFLPPGPSGLASPPGRD